MGIIAAGQITVVDLSDAPVLNTFITASRPTTQTYSKDSRTYKPSYASTPQVLTLKVTKGGSTANIIDSISSLHWFVVDGPIKTEITSKDNSANEYISGTHNEILTTKLDIDLNKGSKRYEVMGIWPDPSTGLDVQFGGYIDLLLTQNGATGPQGPQGDTGNGIANTVITYGLSMSDTTEPATWSSEMPALVKGMYLWTRTVIIYTNGSSTTSYQISYIAKDADATAEIDKTKQELLEKLETVRDDSLAAVDEAKQQLVTVRDESLAAAEEAKQGLINVNTKVDNAKEELTQAKQDLANVASELNTAKQDLTDSVSAVNTKVDNAKEELTQAKQDLTNVASELNTAKQDLANSVTAVNTKVDNAKEELTQAKQDLTNVASELNTAKQDLTDSVSAVNTKVDNTKAELTQAKQQLTTVSDDLSKAKTDFQNAVSAVDTKATNLKNDLTQAKQDLASQAQQLQTQASAQSELTNRVSSVEKMANGTKTTVGELSKTVAQNGKDITSVTARTKVVEDDLAGTKTTLSQVKTTADSTSRKTATLETGLNGLNARFDSLSVGGTNLIKQSTAQKGLRLAMGAEPLVDNNHMLTDWIKIEPSTVYTLTTYEDVNEAAMYYSLAWFSTNNSNHSGWISRPTGAASAANLKGGKQYTSPANAAYAKVSYPTKYAKVKFERGNIATDYSPNDTDLEQKVAEYKQNADQNYASLQTTVQNLDGTVQHNKTVAEQTAAGFKTRIESLETYKDGETTRANQYFELAKTETARQLTAERTAIAKDYVAKSTYTSDVTGIRNDLTATTTTANTTKTNLANYQASNDRAVANLQSNLQTANGNISSLKTKVEAVPGQITSAVSAVEGKIPTSVGGRNLIIKAQIQNGYINDNGNLATATTQFTTGFIDGTKSKQFVITAPKFAVGDLEYLRLAKYDSSKKFLGRELFRYDSNKDKTIKTITLADNVSYFKISFDGVYKEPFKIERGNVATDWSPAPEDAIEEISNLSSEIKQTADGMTLLATKTELNTAKSDLQSGINTATNKANAAQNKANSNAQTISTHTTQISALNTGLQAKVSQTDFNTLSGRVTTAENNIIAKANELSSKITSVEGAIEDTQSDITKLSSEIKQTADGMTLLATKTELNTAKNELQSGINTATNKANAAQNTANNNAQTISTHTTQISALNTGLQAKVSQTDFNTLSGRVTTAENNITAKANELSSKITSVEGKIPTSVGGRNLLSKTNQGKTNWSWAISSGGTTAENYDVNGINAVKLTRTSDASFSWDYIQYKGLIRNLIEPNTKYTLSFDVKPSVDVTFSADLKRGDSGATLLTKGVMMNKATANQWNKVSCVLTSKTTLPDDLSQVVYLSGMPVIKGNYLIIKNIKLEKGTVSSDWSPAPEDTIEQIDAVSSEIKQTADGMTLLATKTELNTAKSDLQSGITTATNKANSAQSTANAAQNTANSAQNTANNNAQTISTHTTQISALNTGLQAKVSQTDFNTLSGRVTTAENNITAKANELSSKITSVEGAIEDTQSDITKLSSEIKQTADGMTLLATKTELNSAKNELQSGISTATNKANAAQSTANNAQNKANSNAQTISTHTTQISALNTGLQAKVSQTDFNTLSGRVTTAENNITAKANELSSKITSVEGKIPTNIGTVNLIKQSTAQVGLRLAMGAEPLVDNNHMLTDWIKIEPSTVYTLTTYEDVNEANMYYSLAWYSTNNSGYSGWIDRPTGAASAANLKGGKQYKSPANATYAKVSYPIKYSKVKLERGNISTDYNSNPEDYDDALTQVKSEIKQTADGMTLLATKTELNTAKSDLQSGINTATNKANAAQSTADSAVTKANAAQNTANNAQNKANSNAQTISTHTTQISALNTGLQAKVSQTDFNTLSGRVTTAENNITAKANELSSKISSVEGKIPTSVGGRNLLSKTNQGKTNWAWSISSGGTTAEDYNVDGVKAVKLTRTTSASASWDYIQYKGLIRNLIEPNTKYTLSFDVKPNADVTFLAALKRGDGGAPLTNGSSMNKALANKWTKVSCVFTTTTLPSDTAQVVYLSGMSTTNGNWLIIKNIKLEKGVVSSDWSPAPEDTISQIDAVSSELKQTADGMTLLATKTELNTAKSDLQSGINTATNKANAAQNKANSNAQTISTHTTQISALNTGLQAKVSQTDFNTLSGRVTTAENNITAKANELSSKITSVEGKIPTSVGGRNLIIRSQIQNGYIDANGNLATSTSQFTTGFIDATNNKQFTITAPKFSDGFACFRLVKYSANKNFLGRDVISYTQDTKTIKTITLSDNVAYFKVSFDGVYREPFKIERGSLPTDWSPAPEDTQSDITKLSSEIKQTADGMTLLATKTELNTAKSDLQSGINTATNKANAAQNTANNAQNKANSNAQTISTHTTQISALNTGLQAKVSQTDFNTLSGRVTTAENNITAKANELSSKITSVEGKIPTNIGTVNLIVKSTAQKGLRLGTDGGVFTDSKHEVTDWIKIEPSTVYTLTTYENVNEPDMWYSMAWYSTNNADYSGKISRPTGAASAANLKGGKQYKSPANAKYAKVSYPTKYAKVKLERGNIATDYNSNPEDYDDALTQVKSEIKQTADGMTLLATKTELNTAKSDLQSGINTATNKANAAQSTADSAVTKANAAQNKANSNAQTISTHTTQISALNTGLSAKVSQTDFNTLSGRVTTAENNITAKANELSSKITSVEGKIPTSSGGRNLAQGTSKDWSKPFTGFSGIKNTTIGLYRVLTDGLVVGDTFKTRIVLKYTDIRPASEKTAEIWLQGAGNVTDWNSGSYPSGGGGRRSISGSGQIVFELTGKIIADHLKNSYWSLSFRTDWIASGSLQWKLAKAERGMFFTDWSPAPEDTISQINAVSSELKQTKDGITLLATKTELNTAKSDLQSGINTATNKANAAQNTANNAQSTANSAQSTANNAQNKANSNAQTISTHTTQISALNTGLQAKVSQSDFNTLSGRVTTAENNITAKANELSSKITSVEGKIPTNIGTVNLIVKSTAQKGYRLGADAGVFQDSNHMLSDWIKIEPNTTYTLTTYENVNENNNYYSLGWYSTNNADYSGKISRPTGPASAAELKGGKQYRAPANAKYAKVSYPIKYPKVKLERGNVASDWSPAPEDTKSDINAVSSELKQTTDSIKASVSSLDKSTIKSSSLTINSDGIVMKAGKSTTDVANAIGSYFAVNQNAINLFSDKINVKGSMIVNGTITGDKIKASSVDVSKISGLDANFIKSKIEYAMIDWLKGKTITAYNGNMTIDLQNGRISFKEGSNAVYRQTSDGIHTGFLHFEAGSQGGVYAAFGTTSTRQGINSKSSEFAGIRCYRVSANGDSHAAKIDKIEVIGDTVQFGHTYHPDGTIGGGFIMQTAAYYDDPPYSLNRMVSSIESLWRILYVHGKNVGYNLSHPNFIRALNDEYNAWHDMHNR